MRILLAEDEKALARAMVRILEKNNYSAEAVHNGRDALHYLENGDYDVALLDIMMPQMDGITVLKALRQQGNLVPVILLTAKSEVDDKVLGLDCGANDYITKPFDIRELLARIRLVTRGQKNPDSQLVLGNIRLDRASYTLSGPGGAFRLTGKEFQLMELLMANPGNLVSSERLLERVWGYDTEAETSVVWVYISYLRKKLTALHANIQICSHRSAGYTLEERT